jgi:methylenetetrahydrofolate dehydrogenase (NADP+)/methenyltetrahydrofolate cyclohydrolase
MILSGKQIAAEMQARQLARVAVMDPRPRLVIVRDSEDPVIAKYVGLKQRYGAAIGVEVDDELVALDDVAGVIRAANADPAVSGMIVQLPLTDAAQTDGILGLIAPAKDVDGLTGRGRFGSATATAIDLLLAGNGVELAGRRIALVGRGRLVGAPLARMWRERGLEVTLFGRGADLTSLRDYGVIVAATGQPGLITSAMIAPGAVVVDAGTAEADGVIHGDLADEVRARDDIAVTPVYGGVGPLTVCGLFENVIAAAEGR